MTIFPGNVEYAVMSVCGASWRRVVSLLVACAAGQSIAAPVSEQRADLVGAPVRQSFLGEQASHIRTLEGTACMASQPIDITNALYLDAVTGDPVPFAQIIRSHAASVQFIATLPHGDQSFRIQLKYSPAPGTPITLTIGNSAHDIAALLEPSGDSLRITDPGMLESVRSVLEAGGALTLAATSRDTRRAVTDRIEGMVFATYDDCRAGLLAEPQDPPSNRIAFDFEASADPALRATDAETAICRVEDPTAPLYRGRLLWTTGFVSQTEDIFVTFGGDGAVEQVYVPGIVEGRRRPDGSLATLLSIAANANDPMQTARVSGCLGLAAVALCENGDSGWGECLGGLAGNDLFEDGVFLSNFELGGTGTPLTGLAGPTPGPLGSPTGGGISSFGVPGGGSFRSGPRGGTPFVIVDRDDPLNPSPKVIRPPAPVALPIPAIPLPPSALLLISAFMAASAFRLGGKRVAREG